MACKQLNFAGGVDYVPYGWSYEIMLMHGLTCNGNEASLKNCNPKDYAGSECDVNTDRAAALCYMGDGERLIIHILYIFIKNISLAASIIMTV